ncbi:MAG: cytochrome c [Gemmatimonadota bacterium]|nr:cytochrome c [Gemmatimonadota bacterium]
MRHAIPDRSIVTVMISLCIAACGPAPEPQEEVQGPTRADSVSMALQAFDATVFDTIVWESDAARAERGGLVFRISCAKCHGPNGRGDGDFVMQGDTLRPPSFLTPDWQFADAPMPLRRYIFSGNVAGMPYWGLVGLKYRDIDAVAHFIESPLRGIPGAAP